MQIVSETVDWNCKIRTDDRFLSVLKTQEPSILAEIRATFRQLQEHIMCCPNKFGAGDKKEKI